MNVSSCSKFVGWYGADDLVQKDCCSGKNPHHVVSPIKELLETSASASVRWTANIGSSLNHYIIPLGRESKKFR